MVCNCGVRWSNSHCHALFLLANLASALAGADLQASAANVGNSLPGGARDYLGYVTSHINSPQILPFLEAAVEARTEISQSLVGNRDLLYLDVALENSIRSAAERGVGSAGGCCCSGTYAAAATSLWSMVELYRSLMSVVPSLCSAHCRLPCHTELDTPTS
eukprot:GHRQ01039206.1.p1 GENE.GHRQ01039206.1~~GHRQ01039206.1.p1  ORF type:complete len:161 (-),score=28.98 GHRQ01039206.1:326-808(-)